MIKFQTRNPSTLRSVLMGGAAAMALTGFSGTAMAQGADDMAVEETAGDNVIIVQARRQAESLQEVPVTVTAIGGDTLERYAVDQVADVVSRVPTLNVQVGGSGSGGQLSLRGVGSSNISAAFDSAVAFDFDGVQVSTMRLVQAGFFDTAQIDVLKGPQSLFFGKSASAGVFAIRSSDPTPTWQIGATGSYEFEEEGYVVSGFISGPISDTLGIRLAAQYNDIDKYVELQPGTPAVNQFRSQKNFVGRATLEWDTDFGLNANLKVQYVKNEGDGAIGHTDISCGANGIADPVYLLQGGLVIPAGNDCNATDGLYYIPDTAPPLAQSVPTASGPTKALGYGGVPFSETELWFARLKLDLELSDNFSLVSTTGFVDLDATDVDNYSYAGLLAPGVPGGVGTSDPRNTLKQYSQEIRLETDFTGGINFMLGGFYEWREFLFDTAQNGVNISFVAPDPITGFTFDWDKAQTTKTEAVSLFASTIIDLTDRLELSGGVRWTDETKTSTISVPYVHAFLAATPAFIQSGFFSGPIEFQDSNWSPEATIKYEVSDDVNVFASFKTGFKSGGIDNSALPSNSLSQAAASGDFSALVYESETAIGGEVGLKSQFAGRSVTFNATAFYYVFDDLQVQNFDAAAVQFETLNAGEVTTKGVDIGWGWDTPVEGLSLSGNLSYLDAQFSDTFIAGLGQDLDGRAVARAPEFSGNLAFDWMVPLGDSLELGLGGNAVYSGSYFTNEDTLTDLKQDSYVSLDGRISIGHPDGDWKLSLIGVNLTDEIWINTSSGRPFLEPGVGDDLVLTQNRGRQIFVEASVRF
ncbi:iron complex outermembrane recepter protein [Altererythrobacter xiamenensis]|uniref:Iron complex outermembrane recepter protein n=1 Tax=Altererythrobacter xiamenensis TaxID=1316679 RepID=A0A1Y6F2Y9_9SPHN|nr:TonB-dependent receptor [Altererythrobacter xiamenensis]SMQ69177.1 iron complex outermembrane recepter protein [Altererythrobacter xiamenensis]